MLFQYHRPLGCDGVVGDRGGGDEGAARVNRRLSVRALIESFLLQSSGASLAPEVEAPHLHVFLCWRIMPLEAALEFELSCLD